MKSNQIFIGNIKKCVKYEEHTMLGVNTVIDDCSIGYDRFGYVEEKSELYKENAILIKNKNGGYIDIERLNSVLDLIKISHDVTKNGYRLGGLIMSTIPHSVNCLYVDKESLKPYFKDKEKNISVRQLKKQYKK